MAFTIWRNLDRSRALAMLPTSLRERGSVTVRGDGPFTVVAFRGADVTASRQVGKAVRQVAGNAGAIVAVAENFTAEARALLDAAGAYAVTAGDFHWTDASYAEIRQQA